MKNASLLDPERLVKTLGLIFLAFIPINLLLSPIVDFLTIENRVANWTVTLSAYVLVLATAPLFLLLRSLLRSPVEKMIFGGIAVFFVYAAVVTYVSADELFYPLYGLVSWLGAVLVGMLFYLCVREGVMTARTVFWVLAAAAPLVIVPLLLVHVDIEGFARLAQRSSATNVLYGYENPRAVGWAATVFLSLLVAHLGTQPTAQALRPMLLLWVTLAAMTLFWTGSRGGLVAFAAGVGFVFALSRTRNHWGMLSGLACVAAGGALSYFLHLPNAVYGIFSRIRQNLTQEDLDALSSGRTELWQTTIAYIQERPLTGFGFFPHKNLDGFSHGSAHNIILDAWLFSGLIVGTLTLLCGLALWIAALSIFRRANDPYVTALFCVVTSLLVYSMFSGPYARTFPLLLFAVSAGAILGHRSGQHRALR